MSAPELRRAHYPGIAETRVASKVRSRAAGAIRSWWMSEGRRHYPGVTHLAIEADCGGANNPRTWVWRVALQRLAVEFGLTITVGHFPQGASKWNLIEHRMFNLLSANWSGEPLVSYEVVLQYIRGTRSCTGFRCRAALDKAFHPRRLWPGSPSYRVRFGSVDLDKQQTEQIQIALSSLQAALEKSSLDGSADADPPRRTEFISFVSQDNGSKGAPATIRKQRNESRST